MDKKTSCFFAFSLAFLFIPLCLASVKITEVMYNPETCDDNFCEWIEIYNGADEPVDLLNWKLCDKGLLEGYLDKEGTAYSETTTTLPSKSYAIITDGGSGTEVYSTFSINPNAMALHVDASSICGGLSNKGDLIVLKNSDGSPAPADSMSYDGSAANGDGNSLQLCGDSWLASISTPGEENCPSEETQEQTEEIIPANISETQEDEEEALDKEIYREENNSEDIINAEKDDLRLADEESESADEKISDNASSEESKKDITGESVSDIIYKSKSEKIKSNSIYFFAFLLLSAIFYVLIKDKA